MKFVSILSLFALAKQVSSFGFADTSKFFSHEETGHFEGEVLTGSNEEIDYKKNFLVSGTVAKLCFSASSFCDYSLYGDMAWVYCYAAQQALATASAGWALAGYIESGTDDDGNIDEIDVTTVTKSGMYSVVFSDARVTTASGAASSVEVESGEAASVGDLKAKAKAGAGAAGEAVNYATAQAAGAGDGSTEATQTAEVYVKGKKITKFLATVSAAMFGGGESQSDVEAETIAKSATAAFSAAVAAAERKWRSEFNGSADFEKADAVATQFGKAFSTAVAFTTVSFSSTIEIKASAKKVEFTFVPDGSAAAYVSCEPQDSTVADKDRPE